MSYKVYASQDWVSEQLGDISWDELKNKPFYYEETYGVLIEEQSVTTEDDEGLGYGYLDGFLMLEAGKTYSVTFNGTTYECVAWENDDWGSVFIGNGSMLDMADSGADEPFVIYGSDGGLSIYTPEVGTYTVSISGIIETVHEIDAKYLQNSNIANGSSLYSLRSVGSAKEDSEYAIGMHAVAFGEDTKASGHASFAIGRFTEASNQDTFASGHASVASGEASVAVGMATMASGVHSLAEGCSAQAIASGAHAEGNNTIAAGRYQHVQGEFNVEDAADTYSHIVGNGKYNARSNAHTLDWDGNAWFSGDVYVGSTSGTNKDTGSVKLATEAYVDELTADVTDRVSIGEGLTRDDSGVIVADPVQSDWSVTDENDPAFIQNKPFSECYIDNAELVPLMDIVFISSMFAFANDPFEIELIAGNTYTGTFDGLEWSGVAEENDSEITVTGVSVSDGSNVCAISCRKSGDVKVQVMSFMGADTHSMSVYGYGLSINTLDSKFLPDEVVLKSDLEAAIGAAIGGSY